MTLIFVPHQWILNKAIEHSEGLLAATVRTEEAALADLTRSQTEFDGIMLAFRKIEEREELMAKPRKIDPDLDEDQQDLSPVASSHKILATFLSRRSHRGRLFFRRWKDLPDKATRR